jgi:hypothetical protein
MEGRDHRSNTIDLVASNKAQLSMTDIATDLYTGSDHQTLSWEIDELDRGTDNHHKATII